MPVSSEPLPNAVILATLTSLIREEPLQSAVQSLKNQPPPSTENAEYACYYSDHDERSESPYSLDDDLDSENTSEPSSRGAPSAEDYFCDLLEEKLLRLFEENPRFKNCDNQTFVSLLCQALPDEVELPEGCYALLDRMRLDIHAAKRKQNIPECGVLSENLRFEHSGHETNSFNNVRQGLLRLNGQEKRIFFKPCTDKYPVILAKYAVASSVVHRLSLGHRASEERLVFNDQGRIIGTISIAIDGFTPLSDTTNVPTTTELIRENIAQILVALWRHKEDDAHPGNISLQGRIDYDMSLYNITHLFKGTRVIHGVTMATPYDATKLNSDDLEQFPNNIKGRTHWPTKPPGTYQPGKYFPCQEAFKSLADNDNFKRQVNFALLTELLSFQTQVVQTQLRRYIGEDSPYGFYELTESTQTELRRLFGREAFFSRDGERELSFVEHMEVYLEKEYQECYNIVTKDKQFLRFLLSNQGLLHAQIAWFQMQKNNFPELSLNVGKIQAHFEQILHDALYSQIYDYLSMLNAKLPEIKQELTGKSSSGTNPLQTPLRQSEIQTPDSAESEHSGERAPNYQASKESFYSQLVELFRNLKSEARNYFSSPPPHTEEKRLDFFTSIQTKIEALDPSLLETEASLPYQTITQWKETSIRFCQSARYSGALLQGNIQPASKQRKKRSYLPRQPHQLTAASQLSSTRQVRTRQVEPERILQEALISWLEKQSFTTVKDLIAKDALNEYAPGLSTTPLAILNPSYYSKKRRKPILDAVEIAVAEYQSSQRDSQQEFSILCGLLNSIFSEGQWHQGSYNYILVKIMVGKMFEDSRKNLDSIGQEISSPTAPSDAQLDKTKPEDQDKTKLKDDDEGIPHITELSELLLHEEHRGHRRLNNDRLYPIVQKLKGPWQTLFSLQESQQSQLAMGQL